MIKLKHLIFEDFNTQAKKYIDSGVSADVVKSYIAKFKRIRDMKPSIARNDDINGLEVLKGNDRFDIDKYKSFHQLEIFVDYVVGQIANMQNVGKTFDKIEVDADIKPIVSVNGLEIYYAKDKNACIRYRGDRPYGWCISRTDSSNMYNSYRYKKSEPSFYFVKDIEETEKEFSKPFTGKFINPWHFFIVQKAPEGYVVTSANNDGDKWMTWKELVKKVPKLKGLENYFKHVKLTDDERNTYNRFIKGVDDATFAKFSYEDKEAYIDIAISIKELTDFQFSNLPRDLKNKYIGFSIGLTDNQYEMIKSDKKLMERYYQIVIRKYKKSIADDPDHDHDYGLLRSEYDIMIKTDEGKELVRSGNFTELTKLLNLSFTLEQLYDVFGEEFVNECIKSYPTTFIYYTKPDKMDNIFRIIYPDSINYINFDKLFSSVNPYIMASHDDTYSFEYLKSLLDTYLKYKKYIKSEDLLKFIHISQNDDMVNKLLTNHIIDLYNRGFDIKIHDDSDVIYNLLMDTDNFINAYNVLGKDKVISQLSTDNLESLFTHYFKQENNPDRNKIIGILGKYRIKLHGHDIVQTLSNLMNSNISPEKFDESISQLGGVDFVKSKIKSDINMLLLNVKSKYVPSVQKLISPKMLLSLTSEDVKNIIDNYDMYDTTNNSTSIEEIGSLIGIGFNRLEDYDVYELLNQIYYQSPEESEKLIDVLIKYKNNKLSYTGSNSNLCTFLIFTNNVDKIINAFGAEKLRQMSFVSIMNILAYPRALTPEKLSKILSLVDVRKLVTNIETNGFMDKLMSYSIDYYNLFKTLMLYIRDSLPNIVIVRLLRSITDHKVISDYIDTIGVHNIKKLNRGEVKSIIGNRTVSHIFLNPFIQIFGKDYIASIYRELNWKLPPVLLLEEYLTFKKYYDII